MNVVEPGESTMRRPVLPAVLPAVLAACAVVGLVLGFALAVQSPSRSPQGSASVPLQAAAAAATSGAAAVTTPPSDPPSVAPTSAPPSDAVPTSAVPTSAVPTSAVPTSAVPTSAAPSSTPADVPVPAKGGGSWVCREGATRVGTQLTMSGTVCGRLAGKRWEGRAELTLTSLGPTVDGTAYLSFNNVPEEPSFDLSNTLIHVPAKGSITIRPTVSAAVTSSQTGGFFTAMVMGNWVPGNGSGDEGSLVSPIVWKAKPAAKPLSSTVRSAPACTKGSVGWTGVTASYTYCTRQSGARLVGSGTITYSTTDPATSVFLTVGQAVNTDQKLWPGQLDFQPGVSSSTVMLPGSTKRVTVALPPMDVQLVSSDRTARAYAFKDTTPDLSPVLTVR